MVHTNYLYNRRRLMAQFGRSATRAMPILTASYGQHAASVLITEWRARFDALIPRIPFIGHRSPFLIFLIPGIRHLALFRALQSRGEGVERVGQLIYKISEAEFLAIPPFVRRFAATLWFSRWFKKRLERHANESQERPYPKGYVLAFVPGDRMTYDYGIDHVECAVCTFLKEEQAFELAPYVCAVDKIASESMGWGLTRTMTLAEGHEKCDFRFRKHGQTKVVVHSSHIGGM